MQWYQTGDTSVKDSPRAATSSPAPQKQQRTWTSGCSLCHWPQGSSSQSCRSKSLVQVKNQNPTPLLSLLIATMLPLICILWEHMQTLF